MVIAFASQARVSEAADGWSETVNGLKARLSLEREQKSPFLKVFIEFQNTSDVAGNRKIRFDPKALDLRVTDATEYPAREGERSIQMGCRHYGNHSSCRLREFSVSASAFLGLGIAPRLIALSWTSAHP